jgi:PAS domain S-box-containing protein
MFSNESSQRRGWATRYVMAIGLFVATLLLRIYLEPNLGERIPFSLFLPAIFVASYFCGTGASVLITALSAVAADWFFIEPRHSLRIAYPATSVQLLLQVAVGFTICWYGHATRAARSKLQRSLDEAQRLREEYQSLFELSAAGQAEVDAISGRFTRVNSRFCIATGYAPGDLLNMKFFDLTHPDDKQEVQGAAEKLLRSEIPIIELEKRCICKNGEIIDAMVSATVIRDGSGHPKKLVAAIKDITLHKQVERALRQVCERLENSLVERTSELQRDIGQFEGFCSSIAHDLRAPLRAMHNFATLLNQRYGNQLPQQGKAYAERIAAASLKMDRLLNDLLKYGGISHIDIVPTEVDTEELVRNVAERVRQNPVARGADIQVQSPVPCVFADARLVEQAVENLVVNGLKFNSSANRRVGIRAEDRAEKVRIYVEDNGPGISEKYHDLIFGVFQRLDESDPNSTGIGLAIVRAAIERMKGSIGVDSTPGAGSKFWIELPKA